MRFAIVAALLVLLASAAGAADNWDPWDFAAPAVDQVPAEQPAQPFSYPLDPASLVIHAWQHGLTNQDGPTCPFEPSCSEYAREAVEKFGPLYGWTLGMERYMRDHRCALQSGYEEHDGYLFDPMP